MGKKTVSQKEVEGKEIFNLVGRIVASVAGLTPEQLNREKEKVKAVGLSAEDWASQFCEQKRIIDEKNAKSMQGYFFDIAKGLNFIRKAVENDGDNDCNSIYTKHLVSGMLKEMISDIKSLGDETFINLGIRENRPKDTATG